MEEVNFIMKRAMVLWHYEDFEVGDTIIKK
jgi:hypothetical protein